MHGHHTRVRRDKVAVIGSANASQHSANQLRELAVLIDFEDLVVAVGAQLDVWWAQADRVDPAWLAWAATVYQRPQGKPPRRRDRTSVVNPAAPLWLRDVVDEPVTFDPPVAAKLQAFREHHTTHEVFGLGMSDGEAEKIHVGDTVVLYTVGESGPRTATLEPTRPRSSPASILSTVRRNRSRSWSDAGGCGRGG